MSWVIVASAVATVGGIGMQAYGSRQQQSALANTRLNEVKRQGEIMQNQMALQKQQDQDSLRARQNFKENTLNAYTREKVEADTDQQTNKFTQALQAAGDQAYAGSSGADAYAPTDAVQTVEGGTPSSEGNSYRNALGTQLSYAQSYGDQQAKAQAALMALGRARELGVDRLQRSGDGITLANAQLGVLNRPIQANDLLSQSSSRLYETQAEQAANKGSGWRFAGQTLQSLGQLGYGAGTAGGGISVAGAPKASVVTAGAPRAIIVK
jgi:hypothetical protein